MNPRCSALLQTFCGLHSHVCSCSTPITTSKDQHHMSNHGSPYLKAAGDHPHRLRADAKDAPDPETARARMVEANHNASRRPGTQADSSSLRTDGGNDPDPVAARARMVEAHHAASGLA